MGPKRHMRQEVKITRFISPKGSAIGNGRIQASWAEEMARGWSTFRIRKTPVCHQKARKREKRRCCRSALMLIINADIAKMPLSLCRADCDSETRRPEFEPWLCHSLTEWPWASCLASQKPGVLTSKISVNASLMAQVVKSPLAMQEAQVWSLCWEDPLEKGSTPVFLPGESHGQRSLAGCCSWGHKESDTTERLALSLH